jgi:hypothetical protein
VVPNFSFETPVTEFVETNIDSWQDQPQSPFYDPVEFGGNPWDTLMGIFANTSPTNDDYLENMNGNQAAFVFNFPGTGFFQDYNSTDWSNTVPARAFNVTLDAGKSYTLTAAVTSSFDEPLTPGASLEMSLYYRDALSNMVALTANNIVFEANVFTNINYLTDFSATIPEVKSTDPWAGQTLGIQFICTTFDPDLIGGVWDLDNIRLTEKVATALNTPVTAKGQISFTLQSEPGLAFEILAATNLTAPPANWTNIATFTNLTGNFSLSDTTTNHQRFYKALQLP